MKTVYQLQYLQKQQKTGALLIKLDTRTAYINLQNGEVIYIFFAGNKGAEALYLLRNELQKNADLARFQFNESPSTMVDKTLPSTEEILTYLNGEVASHDSAITCSEPMLEPVQQPAKADSNDKTILPKLTTAKIESIVIELIGPMGSIICSEATKSADSLETAIDAIASKLTELNMAYTFMDKIQTALADDIA